MRELRYQSEMAIAAHAVREGSTQLVAQALDWLFGSSAVQDYRDVISALTLYNDALTRLGENADTFLKDYALSNPTSQEQIHSFIGRSSDLKTLASAGYKVVFDPEFRYEENWS